MKTAVIIQARMNSTRLPGKVLMDLAGKPVLQHVVERCRRANVDDVIVATCDPYKDIAKLCKALDCKCFSGDEDNVYQRVLDCAKTFDIDIIVEITADCPLIDPEHIDEILYALRNFDYIFSSNCIERCLPDGFDIQVYPAHILKDTVPVNTNHVGWNIQESLNNIAEYPERRKRGNMEYPEGRYNHPYWAVTLDTHEDYEVLKLIFEHFENNEFSAEDVMEFLFRNPQILAINHNVKRKEPGEE